MKLYIGRSGVDQCALATVLYKYMQATRSRKKESLNPCAAPKSENNETTSCCSGEGGTEEDQPQQRQVRQLTVR